MENSWLNLLTKRKLQLLANGLHFAGVEDLPRDTILDFIFEIYDIYELPAKIGPPFYIFVSDRDVIVFQIESTPLYNYTPVLDIYNYNKMNINKESIIVKKGKKTYIIDKEIRYGVDV